MNSRDAVRESVFEILGPGFKGCIPLAWFEVLDPDTIAPAFPEFAAMPNPVWMAVGIIDDVSMFELADGKWFGDMIRVARPAADADRQMGGLFLGGEDARELEAVLTDGRKPVWATRRPTLCSCCLGRSASSVRSLTRTWSHERLDRDTTVLAGQWMRERLLPRGPLRGGRKGRPMPEWRGVWASSHW